MQLHSNNAIVRNTVLAQVTCASCELSCTRSDPTHWQLYWPPVQFLSPMQMRTKKLTTARFRIETYLTDALRCVEQNVLAMKIITPKFDLLILPNNLTPPSLSVVRLLPEPPRTNKTPPSVAFLLAQRNCRYFDQVVLHLPATLPWLFKQQPGAGLPVSQLTRCRVPAGADRRFWRR